MQGLVHQEIMDSISCMLTRRSIRKFQDAAIEWDKVGIIAEAANAAPSAGNLQLAKFVVVTDEDIRKKLAEACLQQYWMEQAPLHFVVCADVKKAKQFYGTRGERLYSIQDAAAATENAILAACSLGLGTCWIGAFDEEMVRRAVGIPDWCRPQAIVAIGYPDERPARPAKYKLEITTYINGYGGRIKNISTTPIYRGEITPAIEEGVDFIKEELEKKARPFMQKITKHAQSLHQKLKKKITEERQ